MTKSLRTQGPHTALQTWSALAAALLLLTMARPASAQLFVTSDRTVANGNPIDSNYNGLTLIVGASNIVNGVVTRVPDVKVDILEPALLGYSDQTGGGLRAYSNSVLRIYGGTFNQITANGIGGGISLSDTATGYISGGAVRFLGVSGTATGAAGAQATISGGLIESAIGDVASVSNGTLTISGGTVRAQSSYSSLVGRTGSVVSISGGLVQSAQGAAVYLDGGAFTMIGGVVSGAAGGGAGWGVRVQSLATTAQLRGGTVNGGLRTEAQDNQVSPQTVLGGSVTVNGGVFAYIDAAVDVMGGSYTRFAGADASFFAMGMNSINFFGTGLALSGPTAGSVFETNNYSGNFYTFTSGTFSDGQSAVGLRLFDAVGAQLGGGFTLNPSPVPEPAAWLLMFLALPAVGAVARRRQVRRRAVA